MILPVWYDCIDVAELPERYQSIAEAIGRDAMIQLALSMPKMNLYLKHPSKVDLTAPMESLPEDYQLVINAIGIEAARTLAESSHSGFIYLMSPDTVFLPAKIRYIHNQYQVAGPAKRFSHRLVAIATGTSQTFVYDVLKAPAPVQHAFNF